MLLFFFLATLLGATTAQAGILYPTIINKGELLRLQSDARRSGPCEGDPCLSWRFLVETNNIKYWKTVPRKCQLSVARYMLGNQYAKDSKAVTREASTFARNFNKSDSDSYIWIFDVDETTLSNLPYFASCGFGAEPCDPKAFDEWIILAAAPPLPWTIELCKELPTWGYKIVFITERREDKRQATQTNLIIAGCQNFWKLILKPMDYNGSSRDYKSAERQRLVDAGYIIVGNIGDQWSDLIGTNRGPMGTNRDPMGTNHETRTFKLPNPMYHVR